MHAQTEHIKTHNGFASSQLYFETSFIHMLYEALNHAYKSHIHKVDDIKTTS